MEGEGERRRELPRRPSQAKERRLRYLPQSAHSLPRHLPSASRCSWDPRLPMLRAKLGQTEKYWEGASLHPPSLWLLPVHSLGAPFRMTSFNALPSLFQTVSSSLLPLTFLIPPCLSLFSPTFLRPSFPPISLSVSTGRRAGAGCSVVSFTTGLHLLPLSLYPGPVIRSMQTEMSQSNGLGGGAVCTCMQEGLRKSLSWKGLG